MAETDARLDLDLFFIMLMHLRSPQENDAT